MSLNLKNTGKFFFFSYIVILFSIVFNIEYLNPLNTGWLYNDNHDNAAIQAGWYFFKNDIWRFPLGLNPNYGEGIDNTIIVSDGIPILAITFKLLSTFVSKDFQYIGFWYFVCFFLQFYFSFKIIRFFVKDSFFSLVSSTFFVLAPVFIYRLTLDPVQSAHWIILWGLYYILKYKFDLSFKKILFILIISVSINIYFTAIVSVPIFLICTFNFFLRPEDRLNIIKNLIKVYSLVLVTMFVLGYFATPLTSSFGGGFGVYKFNILTIFDSVVQRREQIWSNFFTSITISQNSKFEAFNYLGLGQFFLIFIAFVALIKKDIKKCLNFDNKFLLFLFVFVLSTTLFALSNKIHLGNKVLFELKLHDYIYGIFSIFRVSARFFWPVSYLLLALSIAIIFFRFKKVRYYILFMALFLQIADTYPGLKKNFNYKFNDPKKNYEEFSDVFKNFEKVNISYPHQPYSDRFVDFSGYFEKFKIKSSNLSVSARYNKKKSGESRVNFYKKLYNKKIDEDEAIIIDNISHLKNLKLIYDLNNYVFLLRGGHFFLANKEKIKMKNLDMVNFKNIKLDAVELDKKIDLNLIAPKYFGLGWTYPKEYDHIKNKFGAWSEGSRSSLLFDIKNINSKFEITFNFDANILKNNYAIEIDAFINSVKNKKILVTQQKNNSFSVTIDPKTLNSTNLIIDLKFSDLLSSWEQNKRPEFRLLGIKLNSIKFKKIQ